MMLERDDLGMILPTLCLQFKSLLIATDNGRRALTLK